MNQEEAEETVLAYLVAEYPGFVGRPPFSYCGEWHTVLDYYKDSLAQQYQSRLATIESKIKLTEPLLEVILDEYDFIKANLNVNRLPVESWFLKIDEHLFVMGFDYLPGMDTDMGDIQRIDIGDAVIYEM